MDCDCGHLMAVRVSDRLSRPSRPYGAAFGSHTPVQRIAAANQQGLRGLAAGMRPTSRASAERAYEVVRECPADARERVIGRTDCRYQIGPLRC